MFSLRDAFIVVFVVGVGILIEIRIYSKLQIIERIYEDIIGIKQSLDKEVVLKELKSYTSCKDHFENGVKENGVYTVSPDGKTKFGVYCDMTNGGWTVIQRRLNGAVDFDRDWDEYEQGFGDLEADHWLGLNNIHLLTKLPRKISFEFLMSYSKQMATAVYDGFQVKDARSNYKMHVSPKATYNVEMTKYVTGNEGFYYHNGMEFSTKDRDNDQDKVRNCAEVYKTSWWLNKCYSIAAINTEFDEMNIFSDDHFKISTSVVKIL